jgi:hypothetical protein
MQAQAIFEAALDVAKKGIPVKPESHDPLVGPVEELKRRRDRARGRPTRCWQGGTRTSST